MDSAFNRDAVMPVGSDGIGRVAVKAVAGVVVAAGNAGIFGPGVVLDVAQGAPASRAKVISEWRSDCGESCSHAPTPVVRARRRTSSHRWPWQSRPPSSGRLQRPGQLPSVGHPGPVGLQGRHRARGERDLRRGRYLHRNGRWRYPRRARLCTRQTDNFTSLVQARSRSGRLPSADLRTRRLLLTRPDGVEPRSTSTETGQHHWRVRKNMPASEPIRSLAP
jgi:hypothetical protein